jgi:hypothetical protein
MEISLGLLSAGHRDRYLQLGIFAEDTDIPLPVLGLLWGDDDGLGADQRHNLCEQLARMSLVAAFRQSDPPTLRVHDVIRAYLRAALGAEGLAQANARFVAAVEKIL